MNSPMAAAGAVVVDGQMPYGGPAFIGNEITIPYFGTIGEFVNNNDGSSVTPSTISLTNEKATVSRDSLALEVSRWAQNSGPLDADPYEEGARQVVEAATRAMDKRIITAAAATPLVHDVYSASAPVTLNYDLMANATGNKWGDEYGDIARHDLPLADHDRPAQAQGQHRPPRCWSRASASVRSRCSWASRSCRAIACRSPARRWAP